MSIKGSAGAMRTVARSAVAVLAVAGAMLAGPVPALAAGGGSETGGGGIDVPIHYACIWRDGGTYDENGVLVPDQGYDRTSGERFLGYMEAAIGRTLDGGVDGAGTPYTTKYWNAVNAALDNARARAGTQHARVVGAGWLWSPAPSATTFSLVHDQAATPETALSREGTARELPSELGWDTDYHDTGVSWRKQVRNMAITDSAPNDISIVIAAVADTEPEAYATLEVDKTSDQAMASYTVTVDNPAYSLEGATFGVYTERACTNKVATLTTGADGKGTLSLPATRTYYLKELDPPAGHIASDGVIEFKLTPGGTTKVEAPNETSTLDVDITKQLEHLNAGEPSGLVKLSGSVIQVTADFDKDGTADRTWRFESDDTGDYGVDDGSGYVGGSGLIYNDSHDLVWPLGVYTVQEIEPVPGSMLEGQTDPDDEDYEAPVHSFDLTADSDGAAKVELECVIEQPLEPVTVALQKVDVDTLVVLPGDQVDLKDGVGQGNGSLVGAEFEITNVSGNRVVIADEVYEDDAVVWSGGTEEGGVVDVELTAGVYQIKETKAPEGYNLSSQIWQLTINADGTSSLIKV